MITTVNPKGQVTIPEPLRERYGFPPGCPDPLGLVQVICGPNSP